MRVALIGGTGFVGNYLVDALLAAGHNISVLVRPGSENKLLQGARCRIVVGDLTSPHALRSICENAQALIYNVGILREFKDRGVTFEEMQFRGVQRSLEAAVACGIDRLLLMSANGVEARTTPYQDTKFRAEELAHDSGMKVTVFRPSVIFGDPRGTMEFATQLNDSMVAPPVPAVSFFVGTRFKSGQVRMSPVHVEDVAAAFVRALDEPATVGQTYAIGGPEVLSWADMLRQIGAAVGKKKWQMPMPIALMRIAATLFDWLPFFPVTRDQLVMLAQGNTADPDVLENLIGQKPKRFNEENLAYLQS